jgi:heme/copper-type cytochrome/quinol oxidase subunit 4
METIKKYGVGIVIGVCLAVTAFHIWSLYSLDKRIKSLEVFSAQLTQLINNSAQK